MSLGFILISLCVMPVILLAAVIWMSTFSRLAQLVKKTMVQQIGVRGRLKVRIKEEPLLRNAL